MATIEKSDKKKAEEEWQASVAESVNRVEERRKSLEKQGVQFHLDGVNYFKDIEDWLDAERIRIKMKYTNI
ncbi:MAG: hypothetical protein J5518_08500 [Lachnospiraceae bacterium]|nr:hypothetical protein [Lachnospiraceae bacterium]